MLSYYYMYPKAQFPAIQLRITPNNSSKLLHVGHTLLCVSYVLLGNEIFLFMDLISDFLSSGFGEFDQLSSCDLPLAFEYKSSFSPSSIDFSWALMT